MANNWGPWNAAHKGGGKYGRGHGPAAKPKSQPKQSLYARTPRTLNSWGGLTPTAQRAAAAQARVQRRQAKQGRSNFAGTATRSDLRKQHRAYDLTFKKGTRRK